MSELIMVDSDRLDKILDALSQARDYLSSIDTARTVLAQHEGVMKLSPLTAKCDEQVEALAKILEAVPMDEV